MGKDNVVEKKSFLLAVRIVNLYKYLVSDKKEYVMSKQLLRCGTSVGANVREATCGYSRAEFRAKMSITHKEVNEAEYWLQLLHETKYLGKVEFESIFCDTHEVNKIISKILISSAP